MIILNFHGVGPLTRDVDSGERDCWLETEHFAEILDIVRGDRRVSLTFDDGNASDHEIVLPMLLERGMRAAFFVCSGRLGEATFLDSLQVRELHRHGMEIGSHGVEHLPWRTLDDTRLADEVRGSRAALKSVCGSSVDTAACPFGSYDRRVLRAVGAAGYRAVFTSDGGPCAGRGWLRARNTVKRSTTSRDIQSMLARCGSTSWRLKCAVRTTLKRLRPS